MSVPEIPGYRLVRELGRGGMATVYLAIQEKFDREVAIKIMDRELLHDETFSKRFQRESQIVAKLNHPHIIQVWTTSASSTRTTTCRWNSSPAATANDRLESRPSR
ncbi:MAG: protein kinase [Gammaproteobacteria bacterium]|nr:protein kinase [Gammaproteobacteria bacterium]